MTAFLYSSSGSWIAFRVTPEGRYLFNKSGKWIGWFPWGDADAVTRQGKYLGTVVGDRLLRRTAPAYRGYPGYPSYPDYPGYPGYPGHAGYRARPSGFVDLPADLLTVP